jgi:hypothetical protein
MQSSRKRCLTKHPAWLLFTAIDQNPLRLDIRRRHHAQDENTQSNSKTIQSYQQTKAAPPEKPAQPPTTHEIKASSALF